MRTRIVIVATIGLGVLASLVGSMAPAVAAGSCVPAIDGLSKTAATRSGRVVISGSCFGGTQGNGTVAIGGLQAFVTNWSDTAVTAYVPEDAAIGSDGVSATTAHGKSNTVALQVTLRQADGRLAWRFEADSMYMVSRPVIGTDGTLYIDDIASHLYALTPDGGLKWVLNRAGDAGVAIGPDNTIYVGSTTAITAVNPDGTIKWRFDQNPSAFTLLGPSVGPDGNIYAVASSGMGVFSLRPNGTLRWTVPEEYDRLIVDHQELAFGPAPGGGRQLYFHANKHFEAVTLGGKVTFSIPGDGNNSCGGGGQPVVGPNGNAYTTNWHTGSGEELGSYKPNGKLNWTFVFSPNNCSSNPDVGPDKKVYIVWNISRLFAVTPKGAAKQLAIDTTNYLQDPVASPAGGQVLVPGGGMGNPGVVESFATRSGALRWRVAFQDENGANQVPFSYSRMRFAPEGKIAYVSVIVSGVYDHSYLYAVTAT